MQFFPPSQPFNMAAAVVNHKLGSLRPLIESIRAEAGVPGIAIGVVHENVVAHEDYYGLRDVSANLQVDRDTIFYIASLTKAITASALGILVDRGLLQWTTPVHDILPEMSKDTEIYAAKLTVLDVLSHRTGKAWADALYLESSNEILLPKEEAVPTFDYLPHVAPVRSEFMYNNHAYNIAGLVIEKVSGVSWSDFVTAEIFKPLGMSRSFTFQPQDENVACPYNLLVDRSPYRIPFSNASNKTMMFAGQSVRTSMSNLLLYCKAYIESLDAITPQGSKKVAAQPPLLGRVSTMVSHFMEECLSPFIPLSPVRISTEKRADRPSSNPFREIGTIIRPQVPRPVESLLEQTYALGWNRTQLPGSLDFGWNSQMLKEFPLLGEQYPGRLAIWHGGNMPGTTAAICLLPETKTAVVVLQNSLGLCDVADWICQLIIDTVMVGKPCQDYLHLTRQCVEFGMNRMNVVRDQLRAEKVSGTKPGPLEIYKGRYFNKLGNWYIDIFVDDGQLYLEFLGKESERYERSHYHYHMFTWNRSYDEMVKRAQYIREHEYYRLEFEPDDSGKVNQLR